MPTSIMNRMSRWQREQEYRAEAASSDGKGSSDGTDKSGEKKMNEESGKGSGGGYGKPSGKSWSSPSSHQYKRSTESSWGVTRRPRKHPRGNTTTNTIRMWLVKKDNSVASEEKAASSAGTAVTGQCSAACFHQSSRAAPAIAAKHSAPGEGKVGRNLRVARRKVLRNKKRREEKQSGDGHAEPRPGEGNTGRNQRVAKQKLRRNERLYDELCETAQRLSETHIDTDEELYHPPPYNTCEICGGYARVPHRWCSFCGDSPTWHHGGCCPQWVPRRKEIEEVFVPDMEGNELLNEPSTFQEVDEFCQPCASDADKESSGETHSLKKPVEQVPRRVKRRQQRKLERVRVREMSRRLAEEHVNTDDESDYVSITLPHTKTAKAKKSQLHFDRNRTEIRKVARREKRRLASNVRLIADATQKGCEITVEADPTTSEPIVALPLILQGMEHLFRNAEADEYH